MPIRLLRRILIYAPVLVLTLESFCRILCGAPWPPASPAPMCPESSESSSCERCPMAPKSAPARSSCNLALEELGSPVSPAAQSARVPLAPLSRTAEAEFGRPLLRRLNAFRRIEVRGASPPIQVLLVTFRN